MNDWLIAVILILALALVVGACVYVTFYHTHPDDGMPQYRDGTCECGGTWELFNADVDRGNTYYFYLCNKCSELIKLYEKP